MADCLIPTHGSICKELQVYSDLTIETVLCNDTLHR